MPRFIDAVYVVMERYEGPDLQQHIQAQPSGALTGRRANPNPRTR